MKYGSFSTFLRLGFGCGFDGFAALRARDCVRVYLRSAPVPGQGAGAFWPGGVLDLRGLLAAWGDGGGWRLTLLGLLAEDHEHCYRREPQTLEATEVLALALPDAGPSMAMEFPDYSACGLGTAVLSQVSAMQAIYFQPCPTYPAVPKPPGPDQNRPDLGPKLPSDHPPRPTPPNASNLFTSNGLQRKDPAAQGGHVANYGYRWYDPLTGRWPSRDPIGSNWSTGEFNEHAAVRNDMICYIDLLGLVISIDSIFDKPGYKDPRRLDHSMAKKRFPRAKHDKDDIEQTKRKIQEAIDKIKKCCEDHKDVLGELGICKAIQSKDTLQIYIEPYDSGLPYMRSTSNSVTGDITISVPPNYEVDHALFTKNADGTWNTSGMQTWAGLITHEAQHSDEKDKWTKERKQFEGEGAKELADLYQDKIEKSAVDAENKLRKCCPELGESATRDRYTPPPGFMDKKANWKP